MRGWLAETRGTIFELARHFLGRLFENDLAAAPGHGRKAAIGLLAGIVPAALLGYPMFLHRYTCVAVGEPAFECPPIADYAAQYATLVRLDSSWLISMAICLTALVTALQWQALFPSRRDCLALASLPVSPREIFGAKLVALLAAFGVFVLALNVLPAVLFAQVTVSRWAGHSFGWNALHTFAAMTAGSACAFFVLLAAQGVMLAVLPSRIFARVSLAAQAVVFTASVAAMPFAWRVQPVDWFTRAREGDFRPAALAVAIPAAVALAAYLGGFWRHRRLLLEGPRLVRQGGEPRLASRALEMLLPDPREQAVFGFLGKTLFRSRTHRLVLQVIAGLAAAWLIGNVHDSRGSEVEATVLLGPLAAAAFAIVGLRYLFSLPAEWPANWLFQTTEREGRTAWMRATDKFVVWCFLGPIYGCAAPVALAAFGRQETARLLPMSFVMALAMFEFWFRDWRKLPFTCSHLPGQRPAWLAMLVALGALSYLGVAAVAVYQASRGWVVFAAVFPLAFAFWWKLRGRRRAAWEEIGLVYEEKPEEAVAGLDIHFERGSEIHPEGELEPAGRSTPFWNSFREREVVSGQPFPEGDRAVTPFFRLGGLWEDVRFGLRLMRKNAGLSVGVTLTLALGIGMNVSVLTLINGLVFRARVDQPETFVQVAFPYGGQGIGAGRATVDEYTGYRERTRSIASLAAVSPTSVLLGRDRSNPARALLVSCNFFEVYHLRQAMLGRLFTPGECAAPGGAAVAVLSEEAWRDRFGADPEILGQVIPIDDQGFTVIGIAPARHAARVNGSHVWIPYTAQPLIEPVHDMFQGHAAMLMIAGRLAPGYSRGAAQAEWNVLMEQDNRLHPGRKRKVAITDGSALSMLNGGTSRVYTLLALLMAAPWAVLLITCANVANLLLSRAVARRREIAVRLAVGAPRMRLLRMLLMESCLLAAVSGSAALYIAYRAPALLYRFVTDEPPSFPLEPDWRIFSFVFGVVVATGCLAGLAPALESLRVDLTSALKGYLSGNGGGRRFSVRGLLVSTQVALGLVLLVCAGLLATSGGRWWESDNPGMDTRRVLAVPLHFQARSTREAARAVYGNLEGRIRALAGVQSVAYAADLPFLGSPLLLHRKGGEEEAVVALNPASRGYLQTLGIRLVEGQDFGEAADPEGPPRAIVSQSFARAFLPDRNPVGRHFEDGPKVSFDVIGVATDVDTGGDDRFAVYVQAGLGSFRTNVLVRVTGYPGAAAEAIRRVVRDAYPEFLVTPRPLQKLFDDADLFKRRMVILLLLLAGVAVLLAVAGVYGVVEFSVSRQTRELGIRAALGARPGQIVREVLFAGLKPVIYGLFAGVWLSLVVETAVKQTFSGAPARFDTGNPAVYAAAACLLAGAALSAMLAPARRGAKSDPLKALHYD